MTARVTSGFTRFTATRMRSTGPLPTFVTAGSVDRSSGKSTTRRGGMSRAGSMAPTRQLPVPLNAMRVPPAPVVVSTIVSIEPGDGGGTVDGDGPAATADGAAAGTLARAGPARLRR